MNDRDARPPPQNHEVVGEILTISGGIASGGESNSARRAHAREVQTEQVLFLERPAKTLKREPMVLSFTDEDGNRVMMPHNDALVVTVTVANHLLHRILVDNGSSANILYWPVFKQKGIDRSRISPFGSPLVGFAGEQVQPVGIISLPVTAGTAPRQSTVMVDFLMKSPTEEGVREVQGDQIAARKCYITSLKKPSEVTPLTVSTVRSGKEGESKGEPAEALEDVVVANNKVVKIGSQLSSEVRESLVTFLKANLEVFAWTHEDMAGISSEEILHQVNVDPSIKPVKNKRRKFAHERNMAIAEEVEKLLRARFIEEVHYPDWLANIIYMHLEDREKTAFITDRGLYCHKVMPFGLKNAGATYQRLVNKMFGEQIGQNMEVYGMKLNTAKCAFGGSSGRFLGYMVSNQGIEANPKKIQAVLDMQSPKNTKQLQQLTGRIAALNLFISRSIDKCLPFFKILRKAYEWSDECEEAFRALKKYLVSPPLLSRTVPGEVLYLYLAMSPIAVSAALIREEEGVQKPVYFISRALKGAEERYPQMEKLAFALTISSRKLRPYFQAHTIKVLTEYPLRKVLRKLDLSGRLANWAIELGEFDIEFFPRNSIKGHALADFLAEFTNLPDATQWPRDETWVVYVDESSTRKHGRAGVILITPEGEELHCSIRLKFKTTNNEAEYEAVIAGLGLAREMGAEFIEVRSDSQVIVGHIQGEFEAKGVKMKLYLSKVQDIQSSFKKLCIVKISREENEKADHLAQIALAEEYAGESEEVTQTLARPTITEEVLVLTAEAVPDWQKEVVEYLKKGILLEEKRAAVQLRKKVARFTMVNGTLYKRGFMLPLLKCIFKEEGNYVLREIHEGICGSHSGARMLAHKAVRAGFY
ncbi:uncharacterized protein LOC132174241 [Corylus avellana]|uniref:uncharacterized protein LOC132174241 n=1 Tax=Corylus avellana TaxID=13451 RepID=UPI00286AFE7F|nr:uncharacterized protein LOC132174241 [Corylus avellana]